DLPPQGKAMEGTAMSQQSNQQDRRRRSTATVNGERIPISRGQGVRVLARVRPLIGLEEEAEVPCLNLPPGGTQLEVLLEPRALLTDLSRSRRRTIGGCGGSRSSAALGDPVRALGFGDATGNAVQTSTRHESRTFSFDKVFDASVTDDQVFSELEDEFTAALEGESVSILAYGATGSGKTHTVSNLAERCARMLDRR
ncbi:unnamed protein product, partial [Polarella glacialis]